MDIFAGRTINNGPWFTCLPGSQDRPVSLVDPHGVCWLVHLDDAHRCRQRCRRIVVHVHTFGNGSRCTSTASTSRLVWFAHVPFTWTPKYRTCLYVRGYNVLGISAESNSTDSHVPQLARNTDRVLVHGSRYPVLELTAM